MKTFLKRTFMGLAALVVVLLAIIAFNTYRYTSKVTQVADKFELGADIDLAAQKLSQAITFETISTDLSDPSFKAFTDFLVEAFPGVHSTMKRDFFAANTPLLKWTGKDESLQPILLTAHYDVVPVSSDSLDRWDYPPFSGTIADGFVWGRGALDDKGALIAMLVAAEHLIQDGFQPERTIYFSFGGDEEIGGDGALSVTNHLIENDIQLAWVLDEGSFVLKDVIPGIDVPVASINLSEKGYANITLIARSEGGHSALPPRITAVGRVARAVDRLQNAPVPGGLDGISAEFFTELGREFTIERRVLFANQWLFSPVLEHILSGSASTDAMLRTTMAPTMLSGSDKENVLATEASATINFRIHPRDTIASITDYVTQVVDDDQIEIVVDTKFASEPSPVASVDTKGYRDIETSLFQSFGEIAAVPGLTIAATDARFYALASDAAYRINPFIVTNDDIAQIHGTNERLSIENLELGINFFGALLQRQ